ncbi:MAG TPA: serine/threonine-protein kinase [Polyangiaceae bacterium]|nr:serine/threonine-protein kinase [Polyangiaceae bacterium]
MEAQPSEKTVPPFGRYVIRERMAEGGMGEVFLAVAVGADGFEKPVVIKRLLPKFAGRADIVSLLAAEAKLMTRLTHPNIVQVIDFGRGEKDDYFVVMELVSGTNLGQFCHAYTVKGECVPVPLALYITNQVLRGLAYAHANASADGKRLVHRDISPGNVLLSTFGEVKVADFGVALVAGSADLRRGDGWIVGKPAYMAPEQLEQSAVDERADIYAVGAVLFQAITGSLHRGDLELGTKPIPTEVSPQARAALTQAARPELVEIVLCALAAEREGRYAHAREMVRAIEQLVETGQKIATSDELAEAVSATVQNQGTATKSVLLLSADDDGFGSGTELTRIGDGEEKHGFTLKIREVPPASPPSATTAMLDEDELRLRPRRGRWIGVGVLALGFIAVGVGIFSRDPSAASVASAVATPPLPGPAAAVVNADPRTPFATLPAASAAEVPVAERPAAKTGTAAGSTSRKSEGHSRGKETAGKEGAARETPVPAAQSSTCRGQLHIYASHGWLLSGNPGSVQAPGRYEWPCGTFALKAISRVDSADVRSVTVTIREGTPGIVDLR